MTDWILDFTQGLSYSGDACARGSIGRSTTTSPFSRITMRPVSVRQPITEKSNSHLLKMSWAIFSCPVLKIISIRSWLSLKRNSYGVMPVSRAGTLSRFSSTPKPPLEAISNDDEVSPAAPMSWIAMMLLVAISSKHASIRSFSVNGSPTCTVGRFPSASLLNSLDAIVAPWIPSLPVFEPT